jgi:ABC-type lipoprotein export system ATPase subunit
VVVRLRGVSKRFRQGTQDVPALVDVSLEVPTGSFVSIMGPSGSGKSTLLHLISGIDSPSAGALVIAGRRTSEMSDDEITVFRRRHIGLVFQFFNLLPMLSAEENVALPLILDGVPVREARGRAASLLEDVGLGHRAHHGPDQLSGGEMQRVAVARALVIEPLVLLADEPTGNLDSKAAHEILVLIGAVSRERGQTVIMVTHDPASAKHGERLITLRDGRIVDDAALQGAATA